MLFKVNWRVQMGLFVCVAGLLPGIASTQVIATGDSRTVTEPVFPPVCTTLSSQMAIVAGAPASETAFDTTRIQSALTACPSGQAVELASSGSNYAFLIQPINIPNGVGLIVDGGVTVFASRNPADYQTSSTELCGTYGASGNGCSNLINLNNNGTSSGSGIYGYGVIDARGGSTMLKSGVDSGVSWWTNSDQANTAGQSQDNPIIMKSGHANNFTLYKITFRNSPMFHVGWGGTGLTVWGVKISAPFTAHNTDGIDPTGTNVTITNTSISDGDDNVAVGASSASANVTVSNVNTYSGHGISVGSYTSAGLTNFLVNGVNLAGTPQDGNATGLRLKSAADRGGLLNTITYENICVRDTRYPLQLNPFYNTNSGTEIPQYENIVLQNVHVLAPTTNQYPYLVQLQGHDANHLTTLWLNNVVFDQLLSTNVTPAPQNISISLAGNVYPAFLQTLTGSGVSYSGTATSTAGTGVSACTGVFPYIVGELYLSSGSTTSLKTVTIPSTGSVTLNAMLEPAMSQTAFSGTVGTWAGAAAPTASINFYEGSTLKGSAALGANGTLAPLVLSNLSVGTHTYTAQYPGDSNYSALTFGSVTVTVTGPTVSTTTSLAAPSTAVYGVATTLTATVAGGGGTPTGSVIFYDGTTALNTATAGALTSGAVSISVKLAGGAHSLTAVYSGDSTYVTSTSTVSTMTVTTAGSSTALTTAPSTVTVTGTALLTATVSGVGGMATPSGTVVFTDGTTGLGSATLSGGVATLSPALPNLGSRTITAAYGGDTNYAASSGTASETVTAIVTSLNLVLATTTTYPTAAVTLTATLTPAQTGATVSFLNGSTAVGTGLTNASGVATYVVTAGSVGTTYTLSAAYAATGNYGSSTTAAQTLTVGNPLSVTGSPNPIAITHGTSGVVVVSLVSLGGFSGSALVTCTSQVAYVTCSPSSSTVPVSGPATVNETITVAATIGELEQHSRSNVVLAILLPLGLFGCLFGHRRRRDGRRLMLSIGLIIATSVAGVMLGGCGSSSGSGTTGTAPSGTQVVTVTSVAAGVTQTVGVTVNIN